MFSSRSFLYQRYLMIFLIFLCGIIGPSNTVDSATFVELPGAGQLVGSITTTAWTEQTVYQYLGIHYAESPSGPNRFKTPVPSKVWQNVRDATKHKNPCPSDWLLDQNIPTPDDPEDCLTLSVYTKDVDANRPVIVFIYSEYFSKGSAEDFAPDYLLEEDVVLVVPQFRLGPFGFLSFQPGISGNYGVHDIVLALDWVQKFITHFGGDPTNVTLAGHSGGAAIVHLLTMNNLVKRDMFHRIILVSGSVFSPWAFDADPMSKYVHTGAPVLLCANDPDPVKCFMEISPKRFVQIMNEEKKDRLYELYSNEYRLVIDGSYGALAVEPLELWLGIFKNPKKYTYPTLAGVTKHAGAYQLFEAWIKFRYIISNFDQDTARNFVRIYMIPILVHLLGLQDHTGLLSNLIERDFIPNEKLEKGDHEQLIPYLLDFFSVAHAKSPIYLAAKHAAQYLPESTFLYTFDYVGEHNSTAEDDYKYLPYENVVDVKDDLQYLFPRPDGKKLNEEDTRMAKIMVQMWTSFAKDGTPVVSDGTKQPPSMNNGTGPYYSINENIEIRQNFLDEFFIIGEDVDQRSETIAKSSMFLHV